MILDSTLIQRKRKITEILRTRRVTRRERNEFGEWEFVEKELQFRRPVQVVSSGKRLIHFLVDYYIVYAGFLFLLLSINGYFPPLLRALLPFTYGAHFLIGELYQQKTIGKLLTGSIVINEYAEPPDLKTVFLRSIIRLVPFEPFSFFGYDRGWHDKWTNTYVVDKKELATLRALVNQDEESPVEVTGVLNFQ